MESRPIAKELLELERQYWQAIKEKDAETAMRLSDEPCILAGAQGVRRVPRSLLGEMLKAPSYALNDFQIDDDVEVRMLGADVAVLAYKVHEELDVEGEPVSLDAADTSTWIRRDGRWVCAVHTESIEGDPFGRDRGAPPAQRSGAV